MKKRARSAGTTARTGMLALLLAATAACTTAGAGGNWPAVQSRVAPDASIERRADEILARMNLEEKVGQIIQGDIASTTPEDVRRYRLGSVLNGGNSSPGGNETGPAADWVKLADEFWDASMNRPAGELRIPVIWGSDAVHGHSNIVGATLFPHNIGLGATRNPGLIRRIGEVTAMEMVATGLDWDFSPTLAVVRDDRWGRSYEGFSEDPEIVRAYASEMVEGLQGRAGTPGFLGAGKVMSSAKHFVGDGGTAGGKDQGDFQGSDRELRDIHGAGYPPAIEAGVQTIMASFSSVRGEKVTGDRDLLTGALKERMGFDGFVVGDWNAHGQVPGCSNTSCAAAINAGLDMFMAPDGWKELYNNTLAQVRSGEIPMARLDDAVRRILRVKLRAGMFEKPKPSARPYGGQLELLGSLEHRAVARQAVRESLVLLKNQNKLLPLAADANVLVAGDGADDIAKQSGGWTLTWQGTGTTNRDFPGAQSIWGGIKEAVSAAGGRATLSVEGRYSTKPDVAIVVFGEAPYAEFMGDRPTVEFSPEDKKDLELLKRLKAAGIPTVSVFLSGRPLWVNPEINASDAFVAAFLPGSEGGGVADLLFKSRSGAVPHDFKGRLSFSWPKRVEQAVLNRGDANYDPLFAYGFGLSYADNGDLGRLSEERPAGETSSAGLVFGRSGLQAGSAFQLVDGGTATRITGNAAATPNGRLRISGTDRRAQEDARTLAWDGSGPATIAIDGRPLDLSREFTGQLSLIVEYRVNTAPSGPVTLGMTGSADSSAVPLTGILAGAAPGEWRTMVVPLRCFVKDGFDPRQVTVPFALTTAGRLSLSISDVRVASAAVPQTQCGG